MKASINHAKETPTEKILKKGNESYETIDSLGRKIIIKSPTYLERTDFIGALEGRASDKEYLQHVLVAMYVKEIDGLSITFPQRLSEVRAILQKLDDAGASAVMECVVSNILPKLDTEEGLKEKVKK